MKLETIQRDVSTSGVQSVHKATIAQSSKVFDFFATQTYSDKYKAITRELVCNALDAHTEAGNLAPVDVYLPDHLDPYFRVRDHGIGMSHEFATTSFMCYSDGSTKDNSDLVIGGFGIGSKSPFAYTDQFTLRSVHNGTCSVYSVFKDEDGIPSIGLLEQKPTNEVNGVEFSLPVEESDFERFKNAAQVALAYFFDRVNLHGGDVATPTFIQRGVTWAVRTRANAGVPQVVMGGVAYPITAHQLNTDLRYDDRLNPLLEMPLDLFLPIGSCSVTLSRESLLYDDKTKKAIADSLASIIDEITADIPTMFDGATGLWEACKGLHEYLGGDQYAARSRLVLKHAQYLGKPLQMHFAPDRQGYEKIWHIMERKANRRNNNVAPDCPSPKWEADMAYANPANYAYVIVDDLPTTSKSATIKRIKTFVDDQVSDRETVLVIRPWDHEDITDALEAFGNLQPSDYILTSSLPEPERAAYDPADRLARPVVRMFVLTEQGIKDKARTITHCKYGSPLRELPYAYQPTDGTLVVMDNFKLPEMFWKKFQFFQMDELMFVNKSDAVKLKGFTLFEDEFETRLESQKALYPTLAQSHALDDSVLRFLIQRMQACPALFEGLPKSKACPMGTLKHLVDTYVVTAPAWLRDHIPSVLPPRVDPAALLAEIKEKHWKFMTFIRYCDTVYFDPSKPEFKLLKELLK